jgi:homoserine O-acetyltransferase
VAHSTPPARRSRTWASRALQSSLALFLPGTLACGSSQRIARIGDLPLHVGGTIRECFVGYRTVGHLNHDASNAVAVLPWYQGTSGQLAAQVGPGKLVDTTRYFAILFDSLGNGVSSSPSNSALQPGASFPVFGIDDMVESQYKVVTQTLGIRRLHAVVGISMGGMQVFQWLSSYPDFMDRGVSIVGSPQAQPDDRERWEHGIEVLRTQSASIRVRSALMRAAPFAALNEFRIQPLDHTRQAQAMMSLDIARRFGGSLERAAAAMPADLLMVSTWQDREVNPKPAFELARLAGAEVLELDGRCGHQAPSCEKATLWPAVARFLSR